MTTYIDPYEKGNGYVPRSTGITRGHAMPDLYEAAASVRRSRQWRYGDGELHDPNVGYDDMVDRGNVPFGRENLPERSGGSPYEGETRRLPDRGEASIYQPYGNAEQGVYVQYQTDPSRYERPQSPNPFVPTRRQQPQSPYGPESRPPMEMPTMASPATPQPTGPISLADTFSPAAIAAQRAQREAENKPGANAIFKPQPVTGGRPDNVADNVANDVIARAAIASARGDANADELLTQAATLAWQREAALNGNERGDVRAPQDYIESWKGQVRAGEAGSPFADMFGRATNVARQSFAAEEAQRREAATAQERRMMEAERAQRQPWTGTPPYMGGGEYGTARGGASNQGQYGTTRGPAPVADDGLITRVMRSVTNPTAATSYAPVGAGSGPMVIDRSSQKAFMQSFTPAAEKALASKGLPSSLAPILAAIPVNEQGHQIEAPGNNYYGIKGKNKRTGASHTSNTWEDYGNGRVNIRDEFRAYDSPDESVADFLQFLEDNPRYAPALKVARETGDPASFIRAVHQAGYATDPAWSDKVLSIARQVMK